MKPVISEYCRRCGELNARIVGNRIRTFHSCADAKVKNPPREFRLDDVIFVPAPAMRGMG